MTIEAVIDLIEIGAVAPQDIVKCLRSALRDTPQRTWVGLTDEERVEMWKNYNPLHGMSEFMRQIEAKLKEKNT